MLDLEHTLPLTWDVDVVSRIQKRMLERWLRVEQCVRTLILSITVRNLTRPTRTTVEFLE